MVVKNLLIVLRILMWNAKYISKFVLNIPTESQRLCPEDILRTGLIQVTPIFCIGAASLAASGIHLAREVILNLLECLALRLQQAEIEKHEPGATHAAIQPERTVQQEATLYI